MSDFILITYYNRGTVEKGQWEIYGHEGVHRNTCLGNFPVKSICAEQAATLARYHRVPLMEGQGDEFLISILSGDLRRKIHEWFCARAGDHIQNEHYQRLRPELEEIIKYDGEKFLD